jgi:integrase
MGIFTRPDSPYWWLFLETTKQKEKTAILVGTTTAQRKDSKALALDQYHRRMLDLADPEAQQRAARRDQPTLRGFVPWYETHILPQHRGAEREREILPRLVAEFGSLRLEAITKDRVIAWRTRRLSTPTVIAHFGGPKGPRRELPPPSARTVNREVDTLQQVLAAAVPTYLKTSPLAGLPDLPVTPPIRRTISVEEETRLLATLAPDDRAIFLVGADTLTRLSDILELQHRDDHGTYLDIREPKNGRPHTVPISSRLRAALDALPADDSGYFFPRRRAADTERDRRGGYAKALQRGCRRAGIPYGRARHGVTFHWATRRTGATRMIRAGGDRAIATAQRIGNWKDPSVLIGIYQETITAELQAAVEAVGQGVRLPPPDPIPAPFPKRPRLVKFPNKHR